MQTRTPRKSHRKETGMLFDGNDISEGCRSKPGRLKGLGNATDGDTEGTNEDQAADMGSKDGPDVGSKNGPKSGPS